MKEEIWKPFVFGKNEYKISSYGRCWSQHNHRIMSLQVERGGYITVSLSLGCHVKKTFPIHRLVAKAFIPNPNNLPEVNHKDEDKANNHVDNLEWCTHEYNQNYGTIKQRISEKNRNGIWSKFVLQYSIDGNFIREFPSVAETSRALGLKPSGISLCCVGKKPQYMGYLWRYKNGDEFPAKIDGYFKYVSSGVPKSKSVIKYDLHGNKIGEYQSIESAGKTCNLSATSISSCCRGKLKTCGGFIWRLKSDVSKESFIIKNIQRSKRLSPVAKCSGSGKIIREFISMSEATKTTGISSSRISDCCNGRTKTAGGYKWKFM